MVDGKEGEFNHLVLQLNIRQKFLMWIHIMYWIFYSKSADIFYHHPHKPQEGDTKSSKSLSEG